MTDAAESGSRKVSSAWMVILCIVLAMAVAGLSIGVPYYRTRRAVHEIEAVGGWVAIEHGGADWLRRLVSDEPMQVFDWISRVSFYETGVTDAVLAHLHGLTKLESLSLNGTGITDAALVHLHGLANLRNLDLTGTGITDAGLVHLHGLTKLELLSLN